MSNTSSDTTREAERALSEVKRTILERKEEIKNRIYNNYRLESEPQRTLVIKTLNTIERYYDGSVESADTLNDVNSELERLELFYVEFEQEWVVLLAREAALVELTEAKERVKAQIGSHVSQSDGEAALVRTILSALENYYMNHRNLESARTVYDLQIEKNAVLEAFNHFYTRFQERLLVIQQRNAVAQRTRMETPQRNDMELILASFSRENPGFQVQSWVQQRRRPGRVYGGNTGGQRPVLPNLTFIGGRAPQTSRIAVESVLTELQQSDPDNPIDLSFLKEENEHNNNIIPFIRRVQDTAPYQNGSEEVHKKFLKRILAVLQSAQNITIRDTLNAIASQALTNCGDRVLFFIIKMEEAVARFAFYEEFGKYQKSCERIIGHEPTREPKALPAPSKELVEQAVQASISEYAINIADKIAQECVEREKRKLTQEFQRQHGRNPTPEEIHIDEIQDYLTLRCKIAELPGNPFQLPEIPSMLYPHINHVLDKDIQEAKRLLCNLDELLNSLLLHEPLQYLMKSEFEMAHDNWINGEAKPIVDQMTALEEEKDSLQTDTYNKKSLDLAAKYYDAERQFTVNFVWNFPQFQHLFKPIQALRLEVEQEAHVN